MITTFAILLLLYNMWRVFYLVTERRHPQEKAPLEEEKPKPVEKKEEKPQEEVKAKVEPKTEAKTETKVEEVVAPKEEVKEAKTAETIV